jgi:saccharopine dehydrogenase-like NADP-dependent oxidoreductase
MCETYKGKVDKLNYKTMRYPGHMKLMRFYFHELLMKENRKAAGEILVNAMPPVNDDVVYIHAAVEGWKNIAGKKQLVKEEFVNAYYPQEIAGQEWRAISWTTACSICAVIEMVAKGKLPQKGFIKQEDIPLSEFLKTKNGSYYEV